MFDKATTVLSILISVVDDIHRLFVSEYESWQVMRKMAHSISRGAVDRRD